MSSNTRIIIGVILAIIVVFFFYFIISKYESNLHASKFESDIDSLKYIVKQINNDSSKFDNKNLFLTFDLGDSKATYYKKLDKAVLNDNVYKDSRGYYYNFKLGFGEVYAIIYPKFENDSLVMITLRCVPSEENIYKSDTLIFYDIATLYLNKYGYANLPELREFNEVFVTNGVYIEVELSGYVLITYTSKQYAINYYRNRIYELEHEPIKEDSLKNAYLKDI